MSFMILLPLCKDWHFLLETPIYLSEQLAEESVSCPTALFMDVHYFLESALVESTGLCSNDEKVNIKRSNIVAKHSEFMWT